MNSIEKNCFKCGEKKSLDEFYAHPKMADGHLNKCKDCTKRDVQSRYYTKHDEVREYERRRQKTPRRKALKAIYHSTHRRRNKQKAKARRAVAWAVRTGKLRSKPCEVCGAEKTEAHHDDYSKPLDVRWLCPTHHKEHHLGRPVGVKPEAA